MLSKIGAILAISSIIFLGLSAVPAKAAIMNAYSVIYFDANNHVIGQELTYCNSMSKYAGTINRTNPNYVREEFGCGDVVVTCGNIVFHPGADHGGYWGADCSPGGYNYGSWIVSFHSATGLTANDYCNRTSSTGPFQGAPPCGLPAPSEISDLGGYSYGVPQ